MFSNRSKNTIVHLIKDVIKGEKELEAIRQSLILHLTDNNISYQTCFLHISYEKDKITKNDIETFLQVQQIRFDGREITQIRYSSYEEFLDLMLPCNQIFLKQYTQKAMNYNIPNSETILLMSKVLGKNIEIIRKVQAYLDSLLIRLDKNVLINYLCPAPVNNQPFFLQLLKNIDLDVNFEDVVCAMRRLDKDQDSDVGKFDWQELIKCQKPPIRQTSQAKLSRQSSKQQSSKSFNRPESRQKSNQENICSNRNVHFSQGSTKSLKRSPSFMDEPIQQFRLHLITIGKFYDEINEIKLEVSIQLFQLSSRADYTLQAAFQFFDLDVDDEIGQQDLKLSFMQLGIDSNDYFIRQLLSCYSSHHTNLKWEQEYINLSMNDFKQLFPDSRQFCDNIKGQFTYETKKTIKIMLSKYLDVIRYRKESVNQMKDIKEIFNFMDLDSDGIVTQDDFKVFDVKNKYVLQFFQTFPEYPYQITNDQFEKYFV